jgi:hypothetical protein
MLLNKGYTFASVVGRTLVPKKSFMKQLVIFPFFCFLWSFGFTQTNVYYPLPTQNTYWREKESGNCSSFCRDYQNFTAGDTLIGGKSYTKIWQSGYMMGTNYYGYCTGIIAWYYSYLYKAIRNDSVNKKVYVFDFFYNTETLLYDFNLQLGDTVPVSFSSGYVSAIDSVLVGSSYHKRFTISEVNHSLMDQYLIEGIGSTSGLLKLVTFCFECCSDLGCVKQDGNTIYQRIGPCNIITGTSNKLVPDFSCKISPNPCEGLVKIHFYPQAENVSLLLYNELGQIVMQKYNLSNEQDIDLASLKAGFYYYNVRNSNNGNYSGKLFKK